MLKLFYILRIISMVLVCIPRLSQDTRDGGGGNSDKTLWHLKVLLAVGIHFVL